MSKIDSVPFDKAAKALGGAMVQVDGDSLCYAYSDGGEVRVMLSYEDGGREEVVFRKEDNDPVRVEDGALAFEDADGEGFLLRVLTVQRPDEVFK